MMGHSRILPWSKRMLAASLERTVVVSSLSRTFHNNLSTHSNSTRTNSNHASSFHDNNNDNNSVKTRLAHLLGPPVTLISPWEQEQNHVNIGNLSFFPPLDMASRHLLQLLQDLKNGITTFSPLPAPSIYNEKRATDRVTLSRCQFVLTQLLEHLAPPESPQLEQCAYRAWAILQHLESLRPSDHTPLTSFAHNKSPEWPQPNRQMYRTVLRLFAKVPCSSPRDATTNALYLPELVQHDIVQHLEQRFRDYGDVECQTDAADWNAVLQCWASCPDPHRAQLAYQQTWPCMTDYDASSYVHMMQLCRHERGLLMDDDIATCRQVGAQVAVQLWQAHIAPQIQGRGNGHSSPSSILPHLSPHFYVFFLQAVRHLDGLETTRVALFEQCLQVAISQGQVNAVLLQEFLVHVQSKMTTQQYLGPYLESIRGLGPAQAAQRLVQLVPRSWTAQTRA